MITTKQNKTSLFVVVFPALSIIAALYFFGGGSLFGKQSSLVTPAEVRSNESSIPVTGAAQPGMSQQAIDAYAARMEGLAAVYQANNSLQRANIAYSARLTDLAEALSQQRANTAYSVRLTGLAVALSQQRANQAYAARWQALADHTLQHAGK